MSPVSEAQKKAVTKYVKEKYDRVVLTMPKGKRDTIKAAADAVGESVNAYISQAVDERMERLGGSQGNISRAIDETIERDKGGAAG